MATKQEQPASKKIVDDLIVELGVRITALSKPRSTWVGSGEVCSKCGCDDSEANPVTFEEDPYNAQINDNHTEIWKCQNCREESASSV